MNENAPLDPEFYSEEAVDTRSIFGLVIAIIGTVLIILSAKPEWFGQNRSSVIGFIQLLVMLFGIAMLSIGAFVAVNSLWGKSEKSIVADFGSRFISTGYVISLFAGLSDIFASAISGSDSKSPQFGPYEQMGLETGMLVILVGVLMMIPYKSLVNQDRPTKTKKETD